MDALYILAGLFVGICVGMTGVGGGALMTPILVLGFGLPPALAVGTDLIYAAVTKAGSACFHSFKQNIRWDLVGRLALGSLPATLLTILLLDRTATSQLQEQLISSALGIMLVITALVMLFKERIRLSLMGETSAAGRWLTNNRGNLLVLLGALLGVLVTLSSIGAGALTAAVLFLLYPRLPTVVVVGTDLAHAVPLALVAGLGHMQLGNVDFAVLGYLLLGSVPGAALGSQLAAHLPELILRRGLAGILLFTGLKFAF